MPSHLDHHFQCLSDLPLADAARRIHYINAGVIRSAPHGVSPSRTTERNPPRLPTTLRRAVLANERTQIRSDQIPGRSVDTLGGYRVGNAVTRSESDSVRSN